ncbi:hypothetical protein Ae201684P_010936 [Aphanomyces euteiches]|nr:hypothetical protein Ae201684P_010936 [Aphanomyces euteiches]
MIDESKIAGGNMDEFDNVIARHEAQLDHYAVPMHLRETALRKILAQDYSTPWTKQDGEVVAAEAMEPLETIWVIDHVWLFQSAKDAAEQLEARKALRDDMSAIIDHFSPDAPKTTPEIVDWIVVNLVHCAYSIKFGHTASDVYHYVLSGLGSMLKCGKDVSEINIQVVPLFFMDTGKLVSLMWATKSIQAGDKLVRPHATKISLIQLGKQAYWENRYEEEDEFDWYCSYEHMKALVKRHVKLSDAILLAGTGSSTLPVDMDFTQLVAMDYAANVVKKLQTKYSALSAVTFVQADMTNMTGFSDEQFDCILDKGCLDTMLLAPETKVASGGNVWQTITSENAAELPDAAAAMRECMRLLKPNGLFLLFSYGSPANRVGLLDWPTFTHWMWEILECLELSPTDSNGGIVKPFFIYVLQKQAVVVN